MIAGSTGIIIAPLGHTSYIILKHYCSRSDGVKFEFDLDFEFTWT